MAMFLYGQNAMAQYVPVTALSGTSSGGEGSDKLVDGDSSTKWGQSFDPANPDRANAWVIIKADAAVVPVNYFLITGNDTGTNPGRNWKDWNVYGANFASDAEAVKDAAGWTLIDERKNEVLPATNFGDINFMFNKADGVTAYQYYLVEVTASVQGTDVYLQMSEFGLGTYQDYIAWLNAETPDSEPIGYRVIAGDRYDTSGESLTCLFDGNNNTKWGTGLTEGTGCYAIVRTSRSIAPTYYKLTTGTDNASWNHRNWKTWSIYGIAEADESLITRDAEGWVLLDERIDVGEDVLPDKNCYEVYFDFNQENATKYQYFKIEVKSTQAGSGYMQMSEFALGDAAQFVLDKQAYLEFANSNVDASKPFQMSLAEQLLGMQETIKNTTDPAQLGVCYNEFMQLKDVVNSSIRAYEDYGNIVKGIKEHYDSHECITGEGRTIIGNYLNTEVAPDASFSNGSYPYIMKTRVLDNDQLKAEGTFANSLLERYATDITDGAIPEDITYTSIMGTETNTSEGPGFLFDGSADTKWCTTSGVPVYVIFAASEPIAPSYYKLTTANDTQGSGRNWKKYKIYGGNFESEDAAANRDAEGWVLIDNKENIGSDQIPDANFTDAYLNMSNPSQTKFQYFRIEIEELANSTVQQMAGFEFGNEANRILKRNAAYEEFAAYDLDVIAQKAMIEEYQNQLKALQTCASITDLGNYTNSLTSLQGQIEENVNAYIAYEEAFSNLDAGNFADYAQAATWAEGYINANEGPGVVYLRGTHAYIMENLPYNTADITAETEYINNMMMAVDEGNLICLGGIGDGWGSAENWAKLIDGNLETKWGGPIRTGGNYVIFRTLGPSNPFFYTLNTGGDTETYPNRNWRSWQIYGANFEGDGAATADAADWVLIDNKEEVGQDRLHPTNTTASYFGFSSETTEDYMYYKVVVTKAYEGDAVQMQELIFGTEEEFEEIKNGYRNEANEFNYDEIIAEQKLLDNYAGGIEAIDECQNMEVLFRIEYGLEQLRDSINACAAVYTRYADAVTAAGTFLEENPLEDSEAKTIFAEYINGVDEESELYPNGQAGYILESHLLADSVVEQEMVFMESLKKNAVAAGYMAGTDISSLIVNPKFAQGAEGWSQEVLGYEINEEKTMSAAEMVREKSVFDINQTLTGMKNGYYKVKLNAAFRPNNDDIYSYNYSALAYANDMATYVPVVMEGMVPKADAVNRENCWLEGDTPDKPIEVTDEMSGEVVDTLGYVVWGIQSCCYAFNAGRYEITLIAKVTDGNLTFGLKNDGTTAGGDWCGFSNFRIAYLGEEPDAASLAEAAASNAARIETLTTTYVSADTEDENYVNAPGYAAAQKETLQAVSGKAEYAALEEASATFQSINETKHAYVTLNNGKNKVYDKWLLELINEDDVYAMEYDIYAVMDGLFAGTYANAEAALAAKDELFAKYPDYLAIDENKAQNNVTYVRTDAFTYDVTANGVRPNVALSGFYEQIDSTRCILAIDYKAAQPIADGAFYFATPSLTADQMRETGELEATGEWKTMYWDVTTALTEWGFGNADSRIRWDLTVGSAENMTISIRKPRLITTAQMEASGGTINAIDKVQDGNAPAVDGIFTLSGVRVQKAEKGLYIINGRKVVVK